MAARVAAMAEALAELAGDPSGAALAGVRSRGAILARRLRDRLRETRGWDLPLGLLDINLYRDDLSRRPVHPIVRGTELDFPVDGKTILLIDDVLYTGRTVRSALDEILDFGRPRAIRLGVLVDRGLREFPIQADYAALTVKTAPAEKVLVRLAEQDGVEGVFLSRPEAG